MKRFILAAGLLAGGLAGFAHAADAAEDSQLRKAIAGTRRSSKNTARDTYCHPCATLTNRDQDRDNYLAIGASDRMTLKFVKP